MHVHNTTMISNKSSSTSSTSTLGAHRRRKHMKNKVVDDEASTLYLDWSNHSTSTKQTTSSRTSTSTDSIRSLSSAKNLMSLSLQQEKEHTEFENANRSNRTLGSVLRRNPSERKRNLPNSNGIGLRLSELTTLSASSQCVDEEHMCGNDECSKGSTTAVDNDESSFTSGRTIFHKIANRVKMASSSSTNNFGCHHRVVKRPTCSPTMKSRHNTDRTTPKTECPSAYVVPATFCSPRIIARISGR